MIGEKAKWMEDVFKSMKGSHRAKPRPELFAIIEDQIMASTAKVISAFQWKQSVAAAAMILLVNTTTLIYYKKYNEVSHEDIVAVDTNNQSLISTYQIYE